MSLTANKYIAIRYFRDIMTRGDLATIYELMAPDFVFTLPTHPEPYRGPDGFKELVTMLHGCFPDFYITPQDIVAYDDMVVTRWKGGGTFLGGPIHTVAGDIPANGRSFQIDGMSWHKIGKDGRILEVIGHEDTISMFQQLGIMPSPRNVTTPEQNLKLAKRYIDELVNKGDFSKIDEILAEDVQFKLMQAPNLVGRDAVRGYLERMRGAFTNLNLEVVRELANDNTVALRWRWTGTHTGEYNGVPASGNKVDEYGIDMFEFWNGKIRSIHVVANQLGLTNQLRATPAPK
jgi:steroid delta-isomerase-like uncharacterized protein